MANLGAFYAERGLRVLLLDFDMYAPSLTTYFQKTPKAYLKDFIAVNEDIANVLIDVSSEIGVKGKLYLGLSNPRKVAAYEIDAHHDFQWHLAALRRFLAAKKGLFADYDLDYILLDASPGIRYWSINAIDVADTLFLPLKINDMDTEGTKKMIKDIYESIRFESQFFLILNKVPGAASLQDSTFADSDRPWEGELEREIGTCVIGSVPCYCDIQFSRHEFLFAIKEPSHPFSHKLQDLAQKIQEATQCP